MIMPSFAVERSEFTLMQRCNPPNCRNCLVAVCLLLVAVSHCGAGDAVITPSLNPELAIHQYARRSWWVDDGLPSNRVLDILQTRDGYLWVATDRGLARFDGVRFTTFDSSNTAELTTSEVRRLYETRDGTLWVGTRRGLLRFPAGRPPRGHAVTQFVELTIQSLLEDQSGTLWVAAETGTWKSRTDEFVLVADAPRNVLTIAEGADGIVWFGGPAGVSRCEAGKFTAMTQSDGFPESQVNALLADRDGSLWIGTEGSGLLRWHNGACEEILAGGNKIVSLFQDQLGSVWVAARGGQLSRIRNGESERLAREIVRSSVSCMTEDREGHLWLGGGERGLGASGLRQLKNPAPVPFDVVALCAMADDAGNVCLGTPRGLVNLRGKERQQYDRTDGLLSDRVYAIGPGQDGSIWLGLFRGLGRVADGKVEYYSLDDGLSREWVTSVCQHSSGDVWIGFHDGGVDRRENETFAPVKELDGINVHWFHESSGGELWLGTDQGLFRWTGENSPQRVSDPVLDALGSDNFWSHHEDDRGSLWLGTGGGLCRLQNGQFSTWTTEAGLHSNTIQMVLEDNRGHLWMGGPDGFFFVPKQAFDDLETGRIERIECQMLTGGPRGKGFAKGYPKACKDGDGSLWIVGRYETVIIPHGAPYRNPLPPPVHVEDVRVDGHSHSQAGRVEFTAGRRQIALHYTAPSFRNPDSVRFLHRLRGHDTDWFDAGGGRVARYSDLRPGDYEFQVIAENGHGVWNDEGASLRFTVLPRWFETAWLRAICALAFLGILFGVFAFRIRAIHTRHAERQRHRDELARVSRVTTMGELAASIAHEINQPLCAILNNANSGKRILAGEDVHIDDARETFEDIATAAKRASDVIEHIRELLAKHATERVPVDMHGLLRDSLELVKASLDRKRIQLIVEAEPTLSGLLGDRVQLQQVVINLVLNAAAAIEAAEAGPRTVTVQASHVDTDIRVSVRDTGTGFEADQNLDRLFDAFYTTKPDGLGMGLAITKSIVEAHGGRIWAEPNADQGAMFTFTIPVVSSTDHA